MRIRVNSNEKIVEDIRKRLKANNGYCPCRLVKNEDTRCMCKDFLEQTEPGECHCGLYIKEL